MLLLLTIIFFTGYSVVFAGIYAIAFAWVLERREKVYHLSRVESVSTVIPSTIIFAIVFLLSATLGVAHPVLMFQTHLVLVAFLILYYLLHENHCKRRAMEYYSEQEQTLRNCRALIAKDPANVFTRHKMVDIYASRDEFAKAAVIMRELLELEKSVPNEWRLKELEDAAMKPKKPSFGLGLLLHTKNALSDARDDDADVQRCLKNIRQYPQNLALRHELAELYAVRREFSKAVVIMTELSHLDTAVQIKWRLEELKEEAQREAARPIPRTIGEVISDFFFE